jgi:hypothetical protein
MAISRSQMRRQLSNRGGITNLSPRQNFGLGSKLKRAVRKIIPNEVSKVASIAAPFVAPFNPALAAGMAGIGSFDQTGSISDAFKRGALTYGGGQAARYLGGAGFQGNPFQGDVLGNFTSFSSPIGTETGLGKFFEQRRVANIGKDLKEIGEVQSLGVPEASEVALTGGSPIVEASEVALTGNTKDTVKSNVFKQMLENPSIENIGNAAVEGAKKLGKAIFYDKDGNLDKNVLLGTIAFTASYAEAKQLANDVGVDLTEAEYDEATKAEKKEQYAADLQNFFSGRKEGGRIGFAEGSDDMKIDPENYFDPRNLNTEDLILLVRNNKGTPEIFRELMLRDVKGIDTLFLDEIGGKKLDKPQEVFQVNEEELKNYRINRRSPIESFLYDLRENNPDIYGEYKEPRQFMPLAGPPESRANGGRIGFENGGIDMIALKKEVRENPEMVNEITDIEFGVGKPGEPTDQGSFIRFDKEKEEAEMLKEILRELEADGGRIGYKSGSIPNPYAPVGMTNYGFIEDSILDFYYGGDLDSFYEAYGITTKADGGRIGLREGTGGKKKYGMGIESAVKQIDPLQSGFDELKIGGGGLPIGFTRLEKSFLFKNLAKLGGADRSFTMPQLYKILSNPSKFPKDVAALKAFLKIKGFQKGGDVGSVNEIPVRKNKAGVQELDMRSSGGFVPIGVKEKADDVPAMLSKNEFVLTADAVRGIGGGSVEKGSEKLYNLMKTAEQVGKA